MVVFVSPPRSRARAALMMLMPIFICLFIKISAAYIIFKMHPFYLNLLKRPDALKMTCGTCIAALMDFPPKEHLDGVIKLSSGFHTHSRLLLTSHLIIMNTLITPLQLPHSASPSNLVASLLFNEGITFNYH